MGTSEGKLTGLGNKSEGYLGKRGWTWDAAQDVGNNPYTTRDAANKANGNDTTAYYNEEGDYVVVDDVTGELVQTSGYGDKGCLPDSSIENPYRP